LTHFPRTFLESGKWLPADFRANQINVMAN
jgi:hypothetical protein